MQHPTTYSRAMINHKIIEGKSITHCITRVVIKHLHVCFSAAICLLINGDV